MELDYILHNDLQIERENSLLINDTYQSSSSNEILNFATCLCQPQRPIDANCNSHKNINCPFSCNHTYELPVEDGLIFMRFLAFAYLIKKLKE